MENTYVSSCFHKEKKVFGSDFLSTRSVATFFSLAAAAVAGATIGVDRAVDAFNHDKSEFRARAQDAIETKSLTLISLDKFRKSNECNDSERPYASKFVAKDHHSQVVEGAVCIARDREAHLKFF
jgi:hypothetical protein